MFGKGKINRSSTKEEAALESSHTPEQRDLYAQLNHANDTKAVRSSTPKGWSVNPFGSDSTDDSPWKS